MSSPLNLIREWSVGDLAALIHKLGSKDAKRLLRCDEVTVTFDTDTKCATVASEVPVLTVWKTIKIGTGIKSGLDFCLELEAKDFRIGDWARAMLK